MIRRKRQVIRYHARGTNEVTEREVSPQRLMHFRDTLYLDACYYLREGLRAFPVDAIQAAELLDTKAKDIDEKHLDKVQGQAVAFFRVTRWTGPRCDSPLNPEFTSSWRKPLI